ncbi:transmembrane protein 79-like isoform X3 [Corythoichthys intestinalis]|uniref:transmembrane protein 79-like isoform X3 n=1 Tax=Corythoichthys intestinalis TaxID=161448 RepID=UPI0025A5F8E5|nr:transmembrane protein 79-like isoform X3 [Corythoichthys intestinalis]XP_061789046.1 transmembrane protein 79-like [Nerophis lumbriciformis]
MDKWASSSDEEARPTGKKATARASRVREKRDLQGDEETRDDGSPATGGRSCAHRDVLKAGVSLVTSAIFFPFLVWGGFVFLPFDAPPLRGAPLRMLYAMRCSVYAAVPVVAGWLAVGVARLRLGVVRPLLGQTEEEDAEGLAVHRRYTRESVGLFLMYFLQLSVTAVYLSQEHLKLVPLLAVIFALGRSIYWVAAAFGSSVRAFGLGLSFLPAAALAAANLAFVFTAESSSAVFGSPALPEAPVGRRRFWG